MVSSISAPWILSCAFACLCSSLSSLFPWLLVACSLTGAGRGGEELPQFLGEQESAHQRGGWNPHPSHCNELLVIETPQGLGMTAWAGEVYNSRTWHWSYSVKYSSPCPTSVFLWFPLLLGKSSWPNRNTILLKTCCSGIRSWLGTSAMTDFFIPFLELPAVNLSLSSDLRRF